MILSVTGSDVAVAAVPAVLGGVLAIIGVRLGSRWTSRAEHDESKQVDRRRHDQQRSDELNRRLDAIDTNVADVRERLAGVEAILRWKVPALDDRPERRER